jgi:molybdopterin molybdotransferase
MHPSLILPGQALAIVLDHPATLGAETVPLAQARGRVLHVPVLADRDLPPFDRVTMDGIALRHADWAADPTGWLRVAGTQLAGHPPQPLADRETCLEVMTGAVLPPGTDTVVRSEDLETRERAGQKWVRVVPGVAVALGQSLHLRARDRAQGDLLMAPGTRLGAAELAVAATVGLTQVPVRALPSVAVVSTGDELVEVGQVPLPHQVRRSNATMLQAALAEWGIGANLYHFADDLTALRTGLAEVLDQHRAVLVSGGVAEGVADLVPGVLADLGVAKQFHKVAQRPGKPLWFGTRLATGTTVFALPGNPVSSFCCYHQYVVPWLRRSLGVRAGVPELAQLATDLKFAPDLTYFLLVGVSQAENGTLLAHPVTNSGSGDLASLLEADGFLALPPEERGPGQTFQAGFLATLTRFREK